MSTCEHLRGDQGLGRAVEHPEVEKIQGYQRTWLWEGLKSGRDGPRRIIDIGRRDPWYLDLLISAHATAGHGLIYMMLTSLPDGLCVLPADPLIAFLNTIFLANFLEVDPARLFAY